MRRVTVVGAGAAGLCAAWAAAKGGAQVTLLECGDRIGGTTALSGGNGWFPGNRHVPDDSPELGLAYLRALSLGDSDDAVLQVFAREAGPSVERIERETPVSWQSIPYCDYHAELEGGREQGGRTLEPKPIDPSPRIAALVRDAPNVTAPVTYAELATGEIDREALAKRKERGTFTLGRALLAGMLEACLDAGVELKTGVRVQTLPDADAVVLASGGFERDPQLASAFLRGPMLAPVGAPSARGDGLRLAIAAGAQLGSMSEAWWCPAARIPGDVIDGEPMFRLILTERARPGCLIVNGRGRRFVDEAQNYNDLGRTLQNFVPADELTASVARFNEGAAHGADPDFGRGSLPYDRFIGDLGPLEQGPYYAFEVLPGCLGTKGGPRTDADGRVLSIADGSPIPGLYAAGNAAASPFGLAYPGAGGTIGPAVVFGLRAGDAAAGD